MTTLTTHDTIDFNLTGVRPYLRSVEAEPLGPYVVVKATIGSCLLGTQPTSHGAVLGDPLTITTSVPDLRAIAEGILAGLDDAEDEIQRIAGQPPLGRMHGG